MRDVVIGRGSGPAGRVDTALAEARARAWLVTGCGAAAGAVLLAGASAAGAWRWWAGAGLVGAGVAAAGWWLLRARARAVVDSPVAGRRRIWWLSTVVVSLVTVGVVAGERDGSAAAALGLASWLAAFAVVMFGLVYVQVAWPRAARRHRVDREAVTEWEQRR